MILQTAVLTALLCSVQGFSIQAAFEKTEENSGNTLTDDDFSVSTLLEKANVNVGKNLDEPLVISGDIAVPTGLQNADPCTARGCLWPKATDGNVYVPYRISSAFSTRERNFIIQGLRSFAESTCIRFTPLQRGQRDFVDIQSLSGCFSYIGRRGNGQPLSLNRQGCVFKSIIQHELLHALGFNHEQTRSDRDQHVRILLQNVISGMEGNFRKIETRNLGTPYDYNSVMHYSRFAFSRNRQPTIIPIPDNNVAIGRAQQMSPTDILRVNRLYQCKIAEENSELSVSERLERANSNLIRSNNDPILIGGDIAVGSEAEKNADPCTSRGCMWGKWTDGKVYIPYYITNHFSSREKAIITRGLESFSSFSCIRFRPTRSSDRDWLSIESQNGCYSFVGRTGGKQVVSLARSGCLYHGTVQHELLHALGFNHEQTRSDRDNHIRVMLQNVHSGMEHNFRKIATLNQGTPYDYNSVMQYHKYAFSKNNYPTMVPIPNSNVSFGQATQMSKNDIDRLNRLYQCCKCSVAQSNH
ncbi:hypothetical protein F2P81_005013 [Scophthalmus maximus]|uniref:Metalloendopeptidase n=1 Tax=Scophthalmus maximus TaxID=52904 RepID=A0A6A4T800_SCOMX|nr:hypothetical protein F2P81_005013 [Scophthalmus maximus]